VSSISQNSMRYMRRMIFVNPSLSNDLLKLIKDGKTTGYEDYDD